MALVITGLAESTGNIYPQIPTGKYKAKINAIEPIVSGGKLRDKICIVTSL